MTQTGSDRPFVSVLMPVRNEGRFMERSLKAAFNQDYPQDHLEVIVADGMSEDETRKTIGSFQKKYPAMKLINNPKKIVSAGLNLALREAKGEMIVRVDGHCEISSDYVRRCVELLEKNEADVVGGPIETIGETFTAQAIALAMSSFFGVGGSAFRTVKNKRKYVDTVAFFAARREILEKAGPFDEELVRNQDDEYNYRLRKLGFRILLDPNIRSRYYSRSSFISLAKQYFQYGFWKVRVFQKHPRQMQWRQFVPAVFILFLAASFGLSFFGETGRAALDAIAGSYLTVNLLASLAVSCKNGWRNLVLLPFIFAVLHFSYGIGFLSGSVYFINRWTRA